MPQLDYSIVLPCLNEEKTIGECIDLSFKAAKSRGHSIEVIVADNGSTDNSTNIIKAKGAVLIHAKTRGYGAALDAGIRAALSDFVIIADSDLSYDLTKASDFYETLVRDSADLVMGNRFKGGIEKGAMPKLHKYLGNPVLSGVARFFFSIPIGDFHCGMRGFRKSLYLSAKPKTNGMEFATEMVLRFVEQGARIIEIPTTLKKDGRDRKPHLRSFPDGWRHLKLMFLFSPQFTLMLPGLLIAIVGGGILAQYVISGRINVANLHGDIQAGNIALVTFLFGVNLLTAGIVSVAHAKSKGLSRFKWMPLNYDPKRAIFAIGAPLALITVGLGSFAVEVLAWQHHVHGHLDPLTYSRVSTFGAATFLCGTTLLIGAFQVRQIISKFW